jgi:hypothetical protein
MVERKELRWKTGAIASLERPEFLRFSFGRGGVDASMKLTPDATDTIPQELFNQHCNSRKDPSSNFKTQAQGSLVSAHSNGKGEITQMDMVLLGFLYVRFKQEHNGSAFWKQKSVVYIEVLD